MFDFLAYTDRRHHRFLFAGGTYGQLQRFISADYQAFTFQFLFEEPDNFIVFNEMVSEFVIVEILKSFHSCVR